MKKLITIMSMLALAAILGCQSSSSSKGGSVMIDEGFKIAVPTFATTIKQGETQNVTVTLERDKYFKQDVKMQISTTRGISLDPTSVLIESSDTPEVQIRITVAKDAAIGEYSIRVEGTPKTGEPTSTSFTVKVVSP